MKVRITGRVYDHLEGSGLWQFIGPEPSYSGDPTRQAAGLSFKAKVEAAPFRKDGSLTVDLTDDEVGVLRRYVEGMEQGGRDNAWDAGGRAELNAARALLTKIGR